MFLVRVKLALKLISIFIALAKKECTLTKTRKEIAPQVTTPEELLREWHSVVGIDGGMRLRDRLLHEEYGEYLEARLLGDDVKLADALADMVYVLVGTAVVLDMPFDRIFAEVHRSNMTKVVDGKVKKRKDGKILKPDTFEHPKIAEILNGTAT